MDNNEQQREMQIAALKHNLTLMQREFFSCVMWLINPCHKTKGRSFLLATAFLSLAYRNAGQWVCVFDHYASPKALSDIMQAIKTMFDDSDHDGYSLTQGVHHIKITIVATPPRVEFGI